MTNDTQRDDIVERLNARINGKRYGNLVNPDGPEAADLIEKQRAEIETLRTALQLAQGEVGLVLSRLDDAKDAHAIADNIGVIIGTALRATND